MKVHLVDGTYELFRAFFAVPAAAGTAGQEVGATRGLARSLLRLLGQPGVTHVGCAFDHVIESFRNQLFHGYKTSAGVPQELLEQFPLAEQVTTALGLVTWPMIEFEADDAIATYAARCAQRDEVEQVVICSPDKDFAQCVVDARVVCLDRMRDKLLDAPGVQAKFGVLAESIPDWLALVGDTADGIPGIARWGAKSAATVLAHYRHLEAIPDDASTWEVKVRGASALAASLRQSRTDASLYRELATLRRDVPLEESLHDLAWKGPRLAALEALAHELADERLVELATQMYREHEQRRPG